jgi:tRNA pseudouridine55 synthase
MSERHPSGILPVEKGAGVTSFQVVARLRRLMRASKIGHGGTLDPDATGVLPVLIGEATKLNPYLGDLDKEYLATVRLGLATTTQDLSGAVIETRPVPELDAAAIEAVVARFVGLISQVPPMYSALRHGGRRLYELAREGVEVERAPRQITVHAITLEALALPDLVLRVRCGKGTYIRTLAADVGAALGCGAALATLVRTRVGPYALDRAIGWPEIRDAGHGAMFWERLWPCDSALAHLPAAALDAGAAVKFIHGREVAFTGLTDGRVRVYGEGSTLLGVGVTRGAWLKPERLLHADPPRPHVLPA